MTPTTPIYLVRHAKAGNRLEWTKADELRPLTKSGRRQADALVASFAGQPFSRLLSSPYVRCVQTLEPLALVRRLELETTDALAEGAPVRSALELALRLAAGGPSALCTHGDVVVLALDELAAAGVPLEGPSKCRKGATWVFEVRDGSFARGRYLPPPARVR